MAKVIPVIWTQERRGLGVDGNPVRLITQYFSLDGELLWEEPDPYQKKKGDD